jgi:NTE family protein
VAHLGVLRAFEEDGIPIDFLAGTSMGAVVGALHATGHSWAAIREIVYSIDWDNVFSRKPDRSLVPLSQRRGEARELLSVGFELFRLKLPESALSDYLINRTLAEHLEEPNLAAGGDFERLPIPFRAVAADLRTGARVVHARGSLSRAVRASMSIPVAFAPVDLGPYLMIDGGIVDNLPVSVACERGSDFIVAVDVSSPPQREQEFRNVLGIANQLTEVLVQARNRSFQEQANLVIRPDLGDHGFADYSDFDELIERGYRAALDVLPAIRDWMGERVEKKPVAPSPHAHAPAHDVKAVRVVGNDRVPQELIRREFRIPAGEPLDMRRALRGMDLVYATGIFSTCWLELLSEDDHGVAVELHVREAAPQIFEAGGSYNDEDKVRGFLRLRKRNLVGWGGRAQVTAEASDAGSRLRLTLAKDGLLLGSRWGYSLSGYSSEDKPRFFREDAFINRAEFDRRGLRLAGLMAVARPGLFELGLRVERVHIEERAGLRFLPGLVDLRTITADFLWDSLDDPYAPTRGTRVGVELQENVPELGGTSWYRRFLANVELARPLGRRQVVRPGAYLGASAGVLPLPEQFRLGGPRSIPGLDREALWGNQALALSLGDDVFLTPKLRLLLRVGAGNVWEDRQDMTLRSLRFGVGLGFQYATALGPIVVEVGKTGPRSPRFYLGLGFQ